ncbi:hypothetical protein Pen02_06640 [Plantactinospora endophytica]|uniref:Uncharacterized protein n=1 Tax=Plantactinospora endophytica TaxID=673535 RepID=A0ABQ4DTF6_9ACTN|nr:hypothetical protein Pen02_06640 [Plantactinospora endophytica]
MGVDAGIYDGDSHPLTLANFVCFSDLQVLQMPLIATQLVGPGCRCWQKGDGRGAKKRHGRAGRAEDHRL